MGAFAAERGVMPTNRGPMAEGTDGSAIRWRIRCKSDRFDQWRNDSSFKSVVTLSRIVNSLQFGLYAFIDAADNARPSASRQRLNAVMHMGATMFEAVEFLDRYGAEFGKYNSFREKLVPILDDPKFRQLCDKRLKPLRNRAVFHFDPTFVPRMPDAENSGFYTFVSGIGHTVGESYYELADRSVMNAVVGVGPSHAEFRQRATDLTHTLTDFVSDFAVAAHHVLRDALSGSDWEMDASLSE
jgi:hypothetical protein